jgi:hypothetical protein
MGFCLKANIGRRWFEDKIKAHVNWVQKSGNDFATGRLGGFATPGSPLARAGF